VVRAALLPLRRDVANHSTGHSRRGGVLGVGVLGEAAGPFFRWRVYRAREPSQASTSQQLFGVSSDTECGERAAPECPARTRGEEGTRWSPRWNRHCRLHRWSSLNGGFSPAASVPFVQPRGKPFLAESVAIQEGITDEQARAAGSAVSILGTHLGHKAEHNNCRMRTPEPDLEALSPTVSP